MISLNLDLMISLLPLKVKAQLKEKPTLQIHAKGVAVEYITDQFTA